MAKSRCSRKRRSSRKSCRRRRRSCSPCVRRVKRRSCSKRVKSRKSMTEKQRFNAEVADEYARSKGKASACKYGRKENGFCKKKKGSKCVTSRCRSKKMRAAWERKKKGSYTVSPYGTPPPPYSA